MTDFQPNLPPADPPRTLVIADPDPQLDTYRYDVLNVAMLDVAAAPEVIAELLGLGPNDQVVCRKRVMRVRESGEATEIDWSYYPAGIAAGTRIAEPGPIKGGVMPILESAGLAPADWEDRVTTRMPTPWESEVLQVPSATAVFQTVRIVWAHDGRPVEATVLVKSGHRVELLFRRAAH